MSFPVRKKAFSKKFLPSKFSNWENHLKEGRNDHSWTLNFIVSFINWNSRSNNEPIITLKTAIIISQVSAINATVTHISNNNWKNENKYNSLGNLNQLKIIFYSSWRQQQQLPHHRHTAAVKSCWTWKSVTCCSFFPTALLFHFQGYQHCLFPAFTSLNWNFFFLFLTWKNRSVIRW